MQLSQVARQTLEDFPGRGLLQVGGLQLALRPLQAQQQFAAVGGIEASPGGRVEQMVGLRHAQQEASREVHSDQRNVQPPRQFHGHQRQRQRLSLAPLQHQREQGRARLQGEVVVLAETLFAHSPQQPLGALAGRGAVVQAGADLPDEFVELAQGVGGRIRREVLRGDPQGRLEQRWRFLGETIEAGLTRVHGFPPGAPGSLRTGRSEHAGAGFERADPKVVTVRRSFVQYPARRAPRPGRRPCGRFADACLY